MRLAVFMQETGGVLAVPGEQCVVTSDNRGRITILCRGMDGIAWRVRGTISSALHEVESAMVQDGPNDTHYIVGHQTWESLCSRYDIWPGEDRG